MLMGLINLCLLSLISAQEPTATNPAIAPDPAPTEAQAPGTQPAGAARSVAQDNTSTTGQNPVTQDPATPRSGEKGAGGNATAEKPAAGTAGTETPTPQGPPPQGNAPQGNTPQEVGNQDTEDRDRKILQAAEEAGDSADPEALAGLAMGTHQDIAARATWLLGQSTNPTHRAKLATIVKDSPHADARLQALHAIRIKADVTATEIGIAALADGDRRVRTVAAQLLGKLRRPAAVEPLLDLLATSEGANGQPATDVQAALLTLADLDASQHLLRMSSAIQDSSVEGAGEALTYAFQTLSPKLDSQKETTALVAVLDHRETMLRRYAITRLTELDSKTALTALEGRLGSEGIELRPLLEVAIAQIRHDGKEPPKDNLERAKANAQALWARTVTWWNGLVVTQKAMVGSAPVVLILLLWMVRRAAKRRARDEDAMQAAALVAPSDEYLDEQEAAEYEDYEDGDYEDEEYEEDTEFSEAAFDDDGEAEDDQPQYDTEGWEEDGDETVPADATPEDELFR